MESVQQIFVNAVSFPAEMIIFVLFEVCSNSSTSFYVSCCFETGLPLASLMVISLQLRKLHLLLRDDQVVSSVLPIIDNFAALPTGRSHTVDFNSRVTPFCDEPLRQHRSVLTMKLQAAFAKQSGKQWCNSRGQGGRVPPRDF